MICINLYLLLLLNYEVILSNISSLFSRRLDFYYYYSYYFEVDLLLLLLLLLQLLLSVVLPCSLTVHWWSIIIIL